MALKDFNSSKKYGSPDEIIRGKQDYLMPCSHHFYKKPPHIVQASGATLRDSEGKSYADFFAGVSVMSCGHCNEEINKKVIEQIQTLQHTTSIYLTQPVVALAQGLAEVLPGNLKRSFFCNSGSEANEGAMLLARMHTKRKGFAALKNSLHGRTFLSSAANGIPLWRTDPFLDDAPVHFVSDAEELCALLEEKGEDIAAFIAEPIQGNGGIQPLPLDFFDTVLPKMREKGVLFIADEVQTGFARTGRMFAIEHYGVVPDILTGAKALGNGFPIGFFASGDGIAPSLNKPSASTLGGNPVSCTAGLGVLDYIREHNLVKQAAEKGAHLKEGLTRLHQTYSFLGKPRGFGLMLGLPVIDGGEEGTAARTDAILEAMKDQGFLIGKNGLGRDVLAFQPPLIIETAVIEDMLDNLNQVLKEMK